jgi:hypothetical protein
MEAKDPSKNINQKKKSQWNTSWARLPEAKMSIKPIMSQSLFVIFNNIVMYMEQIDQNINKQMLETTYTLKLSPLLKITPNL